MPQRASAADVVAAVTARAARRPGACWIGIDGFGGAGKSTLSALIAAKVPRACVVHVDDFSGPAVQEWDWARFAREVVAPLRAGRPARYQAWAWDAERGGAWHDVPVGAVVVVEGVSATRREVDVEWDLTVWVDAPLGLRLARARERDGEAVMARWLEEWMPSEQAYAARERPQERVDLLVDGTAG